MYVRVCAWESQVFASDGFSCVRESQRKKRFGSQSKFASGLRGVFTIHLVTRKPLGMMSKGFAYFVSESLFVSLL